jgi:hypothetical protein
MSELNKKQMKVLKKIAQKKLRESIYYQQVSQVMYKSPPGYVDYNNPIEKLAKKLYMAQDFDNYPFNTENENRKKQEQHVKILRLEQIKVLRPYWVSPELTEAFKSSTVPKLPHLNTNALTGLIFFPSNNNSFYCQETKQLRTVDWIYYSFDNFQGFGSLYASPIAGGLLISTDYLKTEKITNKNNANDNNSLDLIDTEQETNLVVSLFLQTMLYIENYQPELLEFKPISKGFFQSKNSTKKLPIKGLIVGENYRILTEKNNCSQDKQENSSSHLVRPHWRSGHWRNQPYGSKENPKYKTIWIQPVMINFQKLNFVNVENKK